MKNKYFNKGFRKESYGIIFGFLLGKTN